MDLWNGHCTEDGELVWRPVRICGNAPVSVITIGLIVLAPPTLLCTAIGQVTNQTYNAAFNYSYRNKSGGYTS